MRPCQRRCAYASWFAISIGTLTIGERALAYEQSSGRVTHQWITRQAWLLYQDQFGPSEIDSWIGNVQEYPNGQNNRVIEGVYDEDTSDNPFNDSAPFNRHFWDFQAGTYTKVFDRGLLLAGTRYDSAANRGVKYFTGGVGTTGGAADAAWGTAQNAAANQGIVWSYQNANKNRAYYWLGNAAHLLQDLTLPCHALADPHPTVFDQDPLHDWVDGRVFAVNSGAAFNDAAANRWEQWTFIPAEHGVGRAANAASIDRSALRSAQTIGGLTWDDAALGASVPNNAVAQTLPLFNLYLETAGLGDDFDSRDQNGQRDGGARRNNAGAYNNWTMLELNQVADAVVPRAERATAELFRYFYSQIDPTPPAIALPMTSVDQNNPTMTFSNSIYVESQVTEDVSGYDLDGFTYYFDLFDGQNWQPWYTAGARTYQTTINGQLTPGLYRVCSMVENGAGLTGQSPYSYVQYVPEPGSAVGALLFCGAILHRRRR